VLNSDATIASSSPPYQKYRGVDDVAVIALSIDQPPLSDVVSFAKSHGLTLPIIVDDHKQFQPMLAAAAQQPATPGGASPAELSLPMLVVIDERGQVYRSIGMGFGTSAARLLSKKIKACRARSQA
jgi:peroxiredoxin